MKKTHRVMWVLLSVVSLGLSMGVMGCSGDSRGDYTGFIFDYDTGVTASFVDIYVHDLSGQPVGYAEVSNFSVNDSTYTCTPLERDNEGCVKKSDFNLAGSIGGTRKAPRANVSWTQDCTSSDNGDAQVTFSIFGVEILQSSSGRYLLVTNEADSDLEVEIDCVEDPDCDTSQEHMAFSSTQVTIGQQVQCAD
ncbi:MAG: hypothetical protein HY538_09120 [Deltaproteobacteria bacterium]|nr:hypothetical protein [Deltaproteobacteria bacterium]